MAPEAGKEAAVFGDEAGVEVGERMTNVAHEVDERRLEALKAAEADGACELEADEAVADFVGIGVAVDVDLAAFELDTFGDCRDPLKRARDPLGVHEVTLSCAGSGGVVDRGAWQLQSVTNALLVEPVRGRRSMRSARRPLPAKMARVGAVTLGSLVRRLVGEHVEVDVAGLQSGVGWSAVT